ncbi:MAG: ABC transporter ATP-binding protein [Caldilineaceae bacterium]
MAALLEAHNVKKAFGGGFLKRSSTVALESLSLTIDDAHPAVTVVAGESGSGKTTLARLLLGMIEPTAGEIRYRGKELRAMNRAERMVFRREVQAIFQDPFEVYNPFHKVDRVLTTPVRKFGLASSEAEGQKLINDALEMVGLRPEDTLGRYPHQLSGGQRQRIIVARALVLKPRVIIADEPVSMVDASLRATILESLLTLTRELGISLVYITHDLTTAYQVGDSILVLYKGDVTEVGHVELVIKEPQHPYTQLLVDSIPRADPERRWGENALPDAPEERAGADGVGCKFAGRCTRVMPVCRSQPVAFYRTDPRRAVACFLYQDQPVMRMAEIPQMIVGLEEAARGNSRK